jgi:hypothetical protein
MSNSTVPAAATGLPTARRAFLRQLVAASALTVPVAAAAMAHATAGAHDPELVRLGDEFDAAWAALGEVCDVLAIAEKSNDPAVIDAAERLEDAANDRVSRANDRIAKTSATTIEGLKVKAHVIRVNEGSYMDEMQGSLVSDLLALPLPKGI